MPVSAEADEQESKVALVLEHGLRADRAAAEALVASLSLQRLTLAGYQQRVEALSMYGWPLGSVGTYVLHKSLTHLLPRLAYVAAHACDPLRFACPSLHVFDSHASMRRLHVHIMHVAYAFTCIRVFIVMPEFRHGCRACGMRASQMCP